MAGRELEEERGKKGIEKQFQPQGRRTLLDLAYNFYPYNFRTYTFSQRIEAKRSLCIHHDKKCLHNHS